VKKVVFVFGILPALVMYSDQLPQPWQGGVTQGPVIRLRQKYMDDAGILAHELVHVRQWYRTLFVHPLLYLFSKRYRLAAEAEAYREQLRHYPDDRTQLFATFMATHYGLQISVAEAMDALRQ